MYVHTHRFAYLHTCKCTRHHAYTIKQTSIHTSICTSNLLVMRSAFSLELRERREGLKESWMRDEKRRGQQRKSHVIFSQGRSWFARISSWSSNLLHTFFLFSSFFIKCPGYNRAASVLYKTSRASFVPSKIILFILLMKFKYICFLTNRIKHRCDEQVFSPKKLAIHIPGGAVRVEP